MKSKNHLFVISTMGLGLALAMILDGMYGGKNTSATMTAQAKQIEALPQPAATIKEEKPETTQELTPEEEEEQKMENYKQLYLKEKAKKELKEQQPLLEEINANAYTGDGSKQSRRLYLLQQAYRASREATPIVNVRPPQVSDDGDEDELASILDLIDDSEEEEAEEEKEENQDLMMLADTNRIKKRAQRRSRKIVIEPEEREQGE